MSRRVRRRALPVLAVAALLVVATPRPAAAHATLISSDPADGAQLDTAPSVVRLHFSEPVSADLGGLQVVDVDGGRVDQGSVRVDGPVVEIDLRPDLPDGTYVVTYRIVSADGHPVKGGSVFSVGDEVADPGALGRFFDSGGDRPWEVAGAIARAIAYAGVLVTAGGALFLSVVHRRGRERPGLVRLVRVAAAAGTVALLLGVPILAALGTGRGASAILDDGVLGTVLEDGVGWALVSAVLGLAAVVAALDRRPVLTVAGAVVAATSFAWTGHTRATEPVWRSTLADATHLLAAAAWLGGLLLLWRTLRLRARDEDADPAVTGSIVSRFSTVAAVALLAVALVGVVLAWGEVRALDALTSTTYGWVLVAKLGVVGVVVAVSGYNRFRLVPALHQGKTAAALRHLRRTVRLEAGGLLAVVALTGVLVNVTPARVDAGVDGGIAEATVDLGDHGSVQLVVDPARAGRNQIHLYTYDETGRPADLGEPVTVELSLAAASIGPITREPHRAGPAHFTLDGADLVPGGTWTVEVHIRLDRFSEAAGSTDVEVRG